MANSIRPANLQIGGTLPGWVTESLVPFLNEFPRDSSETWPWTSPSIVSRLGDEIWSMLGRWQARRAIVVDRSLFDKALAEPVCQLALSLNELNVSCLLDASALAPPARLDWLKRVVEATVTLSSIKKTKTPLPMFGSKILHHFFPSTVPVFDTRRVTEGLMTGAEFVEFARNVDARRSGDDDQWFAVAAEFEKGVESMFADARLVDSPRRKARREVLRAFQPFARYVSFCAWLIEGATRRDLRACRGVLLEQFNAQPSARRGAAETIADRLDAKIAELCATSAAVGWRSLADSSDDE